MTMEIEKKLATWTQQPYFTVEELLAALERDINLNLVIGRILNTFEFDISSNAYWKPYRKHRSFKGNIDAPKFETLGLRYEK